MQGKVAIVTGGARGMGLHFARALAEAGAAVIVQDIAGAAEAAAKLRAEGYDAIHAEGDIASEADVARMAEHAMNRHGRIDVLVNNAAIFTSLLPTPFVELSVEEWDRIMAVNARGPFLPRAPWSGRCSGTAAAASSTSRPRWPIPACLSSSTTPQAKVRWCP